MQYVICIDKNCNNVTNFNINVLIYYYFIGYNNIEGYSTALMWDVFGLLVLNVAFI